MHLTGIELNEIEQRLARIEERDGLILRLVEKILHRLEYQHPCPPCPPPPTLTHSITNQFSGDNTAMANNALVFAVGQTSTDTVTPLLADGITSSGGVVSNLTITFSDPSASVTVNGPATALFTALAPSTAGPVVGTTQCTVTDTDGAISQWTQTFTVLVNAVVPPSQLTQSIANVFSTPA